MSRDTSNYGNGGVTVALCARFLEWIPEVPADVSWLFGVAGDVYRQAWRGSPAGSIR